MWAIERHQECHSWPGAHCANCSVRAVRISIFLAKQSKRVNEVYQHIFSLKSTELTSELQSSSIWQRNITWRTPSRTTACVGTVFCYCTLSCTGLHARDWHRQRAEVWQLSQIATTATLFCRARWEGQLFMSGNQKNWVERTERL